MKFQPERLLQLRTSLNINKAEAARRLNISAMAYGRYEKTNASLPIRPYAISPRPLTVMLTSLWYF